MLEITFGAGGEIPLVERACVAAAGGDQGVLRRRPGAGGSPSTSLSRRIEATIVHSRGSRRSSSQATASGVWAPSRTSSEPRRSRRPGQRGLDLGLDRIGRGMPRPPRVRRRAGSRRSGTRPRHSSSGSTTIAPGFATASFSRAICSRVSPRTSVCSRPTFVSSTTRRVEDVRRVEPAAEPGFDHRGVDLALREERERGGRQRLELRRVHGLGCVADVRHGALERLGIGVESLVPAADVRRRVRADVEILRSKQRGDRARRRRLAVRSDDVHGAVRALRIAQRIEERVHASEPELLRPGRQRRDPLRGRQRRMR